MHSAADAQPLGLRGLLRWLLGITRPVHPPLLISAACRIISLCLDVALFAAAAGFVVTLTLEGGHTFGVLMILVALALSKATFFYLEQFSGHYVAFKALELLRTHVFAAMWPKAPAVVAYSRSADVLASLTRDVDRIEVVYAHTFAPVVSAYVVGPLAVIVAGLLVGWGPVTVAAVCLGISLFVVPFVGTRSAMAATRGTLRRRRDLSHHISDSVFGADEVLGYGREEDRLAAMDELGRGIARSAQTPRDLNGVRRGANVSLSVVAALSVVWVGRHGAVDVTPAMLAALVAGTLRVFEAPRGVEDAVGYLDHSLAAARRLWQISNEPERVTDGPVELSLDHAPAVRFENVTYAYPARGDGEPTDAVTEVSLLVPAGGHGVLLGHSGSGKSTLVQLLVRYDDPRTGQITLDDVPITRYSLDSLRRNVVFVPQKSQLLDCSLGENLRLGAPAATDAQLWSVLAAVGLADEIRAMPEGLRTGVGPNGSALSGGQVQRACLARALLMEPKVLVLDEFTANLNVGLEAEIRAALHSWPQEMTVIEVSHRSEAASRADVVALVDQGRLVEIEPLAEPA